MSEETQNIDNIQDDFSGQIDDSKLPGYEDVEAASFEELSTFTDEQFINSFLVVAASYIGVSRASNLQQVGKFLALFGLPTKMDGAWVPYCASGASYAAAKTVCNLSGVPYTADNAVSVFKTVLPIIKNRFFTPSPSCWAMKKGAIAKGNWVEKSAVSKANIKSGWLVLYNFEGQTTPHHVGIVEKALDNEIHTIEFNTSSTDNRNGGAVSRRVRGYGAVLGYIKTY